jgi:hypothetical protein
VGGTSLGSPLTAAAGDYGAIDIIALSSTDTAAGTVSDFLLATLTIIPEPASFLLLLLGGTAFLGRRRRRA